MKEILKESIQRIEREVNVFRDKYHQGLYFILEADNNHADRLLRIYDTETDLYKFFIKLSVSGSTVLLTFSGFFINQSKHIWILLIIFIALSAFFIYKLFKLKRTKEKILEKDSEKINAFLKELNELKQSYSKMENSYSDLMDKLLNIDIKEYEKSFDKIS